MKLIVIFGIPYSRKAYLGLQSSYLTSMQLLKL